VKESNNASDDCKSKSLRRAKCGNMTHRENDKIKENVRNTHTFRFIVERWRAVTTIISSNSPMVYKLSSHVDTTSKTCAEVMDFSTGYIFFCIDRTSQRRKLFNPAPKKKTQIGQVGGAFVRNTIAYAFRI
jgi:hypothetical protein